MFLKEAQSLKCRTKTYLMILLHFLWRFFILKKDKIMNLY